MVDFVQVMKDWRRMCKTVGGESCDGCKLHIAGNDCVAVYEGEMDYAQAEKSITAWAAEHPEPVYPTWVDWFRQMGVVKPTQICFHDWLLKPIPAAIAERLGIEPKEDA